MGPSLYIVFLLAHVPNASLFPLIIALSEMGMREGARGEKVLNAIFTVCCRVKIILSSEQARGSCMEKALFICNHWGWELRKQMSMVNIQVRTIFLVLISPWESGF
jgi:hypothetical protein